MCTLTFIAVDGGVGNPPGMRVVMNRDELRTRGAALAPQWRELAGGTRAIWPMDPLGGGTWIAATSAGLVLCLLNLNLEPMPELPRGLVSRGQVIPKVVEAGGVTRLLEAVRRTDLSVFAPFRLIVADRPTEEEQVVWEARWDRSHLTTSRHAGMPVCFVSSGLGDSAVAGRLELFKQRLEVVRTPQMQDRFHAHVWAGHEDVSVMMSRRDARTVSVTTVEVGGAGAGPEVRMIYRPVREDREDAALQPLAVISPVGMAAVGAGLGR